MIAAAGVLAFAFLFVSWRLYTYAASRRENISRGAEQYASDWTVLSLLSAACLVLIGVVLLGVSVIHLVRDEALAARDLVVGVGLLIGAALFCLMGVAHFIKGAAYYDRERSNPERDVRTVPFLPAAPGYLGATFAMIIGGVLLFLSLETLL